MPCKTKGRTAEEKAEAAKWYAINKNLGRLKHQHGKNKPGSKRK